MEKSLGQQAAEAVHKYIRQPGVRDRITYREISIRDLANLTGIINQVYEGTFDEARWNFKCIV